MLLKLNNLSVDIICYFTYQMASNFANAIIKF